jgi:hypothetical protein
MLPYANVQTAIACRIFDIRIAERRSRSKMLRI